MALLTCVAQASISSQNVYASGSAPSATIPLPDLSNLPNHDNQALALAAVKYKSLFDAVTPSLGSADQSCTDLNPQHSPLATGALKFNVVDFLAYNSQSSQNIGFGPGIALTTIQTATVVSGRVILSRGGQIFQTLPLEDYTGQWPYWPSKRPGKVKIVGNKLVIATSKFQSSVYQKPEGSSSYFLIALRAPNHTLRYQYGADGLVSITSNNACDPVQSYTYTNGKLASVEFKSSVGTGKRTELSYDAVGNLSEYKTSLINSPKVGEIPNSATRKITWYDGKIVSVTDDTEKYSRQYAYVDKKVLPQNQWA